MTQTFRAALGRWHEIRIRSIWMKCAFVVGWWVVGFGIARLLSLVGLSDLGIVIVGAVYDFAVIAVGTRMFRGAYEDPVRARPWWRASGRPAAGFVFAGLLAFFAVWALVRISTDFVNVVFTVEQAVVAVYYFQSSVRLARGQGGAEVPRRREQQPLAKGLAKPFKF